jgi:hypothetical protein
MPTTMTVSQFVYRAGTVSSLYRNSEAEVGKLPPHAQDAWNAFADLLGLLADIGKLEGLRDIYAQNAPDLPVTADQAAFLRSMELRVSLAYTARYDVASAAPAKGSSVETLLRTLVENARAALAETQSKLVRQSSLWPYLLAGGMTAAVVLVVLNWNAPPMPSLAAQ